MLSLLLKPFLNENADKIELSSDAEISLSMIESGCMFDTFDDKAALIIVAPDSDIDTLRNINRASFDFELIERPEFPSLAMKMELNTAANVAYKFDYFFNTESPTSIGLLEKLKKQNYFDIHFYSEEIVHSKKIEFSDKDKIEFAALIDKVIS
ncbi:MAG: hypothetical protein AAF462_03425 [Thermodesulfobacteriota bacterium]